MGSLPPTTVQGYTKGFTLQNILDITNIITMPAIDSINTVAKDLVSQISSLVPGLDSSIVTTIILPMILIILGAVLIYDLYILYQALSTAASLNSSRSLMSPMILKAAKDVLGLKDEITFD